MSQPPELDPPDGASESGPGPGSPEVQTALGIQPTSFKTQLQRACRKLEANSLNEALVQARELGII